MGARPTHCAYEGQICNLPANIPQNVAFGSDGQYHFRDIINQPSIMCDAQLFGYPQAISETRAQCLTRPIPQFMLNPDGTPIGFTKCADESGMCFSLYESDILYGANGKFHTGFVPANQRIDCNNNVFGDPATGSDTHNESIKNECWIRDSHQQMPLTPIRVNTEPVYVNQAAIEIRPPPITIRPEPINIQPTPINIRPEPININPVPISVYRGPINVQPAPISVQPTLINVQPAPVSVSPVPINIEPAQVNIHPTPVNFQSGRFNVQPTPVNVGPPQINILPTPIQMNDTNPAEINMQPVKINLVPIPHNAATTPADMPYSLINTPASLIDRPIANNIEHFNNKINSNLQSVSASDMARAIIAHINYGRRNPSNYVNLTDDNVAGYNASDNLYFSNF